MYPITPSQPINELNQYVVHVPGRYFSAEHIAIARDEGSGLKIIGSDSNNFPVFYGPSPVGTVCRQRAGLTVRGNLLLGGQKIRPEDYLSIWRSIKPVSIEDLASLYGIKLKARLDLNMPAESANEWGRSYILRKTGPQTFQEYCIAYGVDTSGKHDVSLDNDNVFSDLTTLQQNLVRPKDNDYKPLSHIQLIAVSMGNGVSTMTALAQPICVQLELV